MWMRGANGDDGKSKMSDHNCSNVSGPADYEEKQNEYKAEPNHPTLLLISQHGLPM